MDLFDAHAHLCADEFRGDIRDVLAAASSAGLLAVLAVSETVGDARRNLELAGVHPVVKPCAGLYPTILDLDEAGSMISLIREHRDRFVAIGEVGLDHWVVKEEEPRRLQADIFGRFIDLAAELGLPLNVHSRSAGLRAIEFLRDRGARDVLLHAFDGKASSALKGVDLGYHFSIPPSVVRSPQKEKLVRALPMEAIILESDSPVLGPDPKVRNEPRNVLVACEAIARIKGMSPEDVARTTTANARRLFPRAF